MENDSMKLWEKVKDLEENNDAYTGELGSARATMMANFGPGAKARPDLISHEDDLGQMIIKVFESYEEELRNYKEGYCG